MNATRIQTWLVGTMSIVTLVMAGLCWHARNTSYVFVPQLPAISITPELKIERDAVQQSFWLHQTKFVVPQPAWINPQLQSVGKIVAPASAQLSTRPAAFVPATQLISYNATRVTGQRPVVRF